VFEIFYELKDSPFSRDIPTGCLYEPDMLDEILARLDYVAERQLFAVVTGDSGTGKTTTIRRFSDALDPGQFKLLYLADSKLTPRHFYKGLLEQLGCESKFYRGDAKRQLHKQIEVMRGIHDLQPVVVIDEGHLLDREMLEEVRFLLNFKMDAQSPMALILVGQSELWDMLQRQVFAAIRQRIDLQCKLPHYDRPQVGAYIQQHLSYAGAGRDIFTDAAIDEIFQFSAGTARLVNKICIHCLIYGAQNQQRIIDDHIVKRVIEGELS
jgi:general secretion pathway protein A